MRSLFLTHRLCGLTLRTNCISRVFTDLSTLDQSRLQHLLYTQWLWSLSSPVGSRSSNSFSLSDLRESYSEYVLFEVLQWPRLLMFLGNHISSITQFFKCQSFVPLWNSNTFLLPKWDYRFLLWLHLTTVLETSLCEKLLWLWCLALVSLPSRITSLR